MGKTSVTQWARDARNNALHVTSTAGRLKLEVVNERVIRVVYTQRDHFDDRASLMMLPRQPGDAQWSVNENEKTLTLATSQIRLAIQKATGAFTWMDHTGAILVREPANGGKALEEVPVEITVFGADAQVKTGDSADGGRATAEGGHKMVDRMAYTSRLDLEFSPGEALYGLGQHEEGILNYRGHSQTLYQHNMKIAVPVLVSTQGYALLWDTYSLSVFHDDAFGSYFWSDIDAEMDFYFIYGPEFDQIIAEYRALTGQAPLLPRWAYGYVQSKERYVDQAELVAVVREYRERGIPLDCIVQDWQTWPAGLWGQKSFDPTRFPDPAQLTRDLHALNAKWMLSIWPHMQGDSANRIEMRERGFLLGNQSTYNAFDPQARALYWKQVNEGLFQYGVDAWWCDCTEPFEEDWRGKLKPEPWKRVTVNTDAAKKYLDPEYINAYSLFHSQMIYESQRSETEQKRVVNLTRSYSPGQQRYSTIVWSGDIAATWDTLRKQIAEGLNFTVTGGAKWTLDIGAFFVGPQGSGWVDAWFWCGDYPGGVADAGYRELYVRWFQFGAFLPMFRTHGTDTPREVWRFGEPGDRTYDTLVKFDFLRYRLLPYIYTLAGWETHRAYTMLRNLAFDFRHDPHVYDIADQFLFGPALMVCPVTEPMEYGPNSTPLTRTPHSRPVYLPAGCDWYDFWTGARYTGGQTIEAAAPLEIIPLFVRAGSILLLGPKVQHSAEQPDAAWEVRIYPGADGAFDLYEDEGDSYRYEKGEFAWTSIAWDDATRTLTFGAREGSFAGMVEQRVFNIVLVREGHGVGMEPEPQTNVVVVYAGAPESVCL